MSFISDQAIRSLRPSLFNVGPARHADVDDLVRESFAHDLRRIEEIMPEAYYLDRLSSAIFYRIPYLHSIGRDLSRMNVLELGCGRGLKAIPWSRLFHRYWGADLDVPSIELGRRLVSATSRPNVELIVANAVDVMRNPQTFGINDRIDCVVMYAVLEHLTLDERRFVLEAVRELLDEDGLLIICETPNRLIPHDGHSTFLHFFQTLPTDLALQYIGRSPRTDAQAIASASGDRTEALYRFGQGASYHEFELFLANAEGVLPAIRIDGWSAWPAFDEAIRRDEVALADYFRQHGGIAHPAFARYWLEIVFDFGLSRALAPRAPTVLSAEPLRSPTHVARPQCWTLDLDVYAGDAAASYTLGASQPRFLQIDLAESAGAFGVFDASGAQLAEFEVAEIERARYKRWHSRCVFDLSSIAQTQQLVIRPSSPQSRVAIECLVADQF